MKQQTSEQLLQQIHEYIGNLSYMREPMGLYDPIEYVLGLGGKRLRPVLMLLAYNLYKEDVTRIFSQAAGIETYHNFTLLHDDLMDKADMRRNKPTVHKKWDENTAILSGDAMLILAYQFMMKECSLECVERVMEVFGRTALEVCEGQQWDMEFEHRLDVTVDEYIEMIRLKTSVLLAAALKIGAILGGAPEKDAQLLYDFGIKMGLAFQLQDDYLDVYGDPAVFGKKIGGDILCNKKTFMLITALNLAEGEDKETLLNWLRATDYVAEEKIQSVTALYNKVVVPSTVSAEDALNDNERFKVVWTVLNALRAHDDRFNATVNKIELNKKKPNNILVGGTTISFDDDGNPIAKGNYDGGGSAEVLEKQLKIQYEELQNAVFARMVQKVGDRRYWEQWAKSVGEIATRQKERIIQLIVDSPKHAKEFENFLKGLRKNINPSIEQEQAVDMLSQHIITKPVFEALFEGYSFVNNNPMSKSMQKMLDLLEEETIEEDVKTLESFYESVKMRASGIDNAEGKQKIIIELYDKFFKTAFPKMVEQLGIVYTPVEVVDFIIHSVADVLQKEFHRNISDENVHILDPFTGTGTFITRLLQSGVIKPEDLERKYKKEIHANEIVLLAYYIASINIENVYHDLTPDPNDGIGKEVYHPFDGICLTDTFQLGETKEGEQLFDEMFPQNSKRVQDQQKTPVRIIIGNPPYSIGQKSANDNAQNQSYPKLDKRIADTYAKLSEAGLNKSLYDAYIKAFRWSTDRLDPKNGGIICFVSNGAWLDGNSTVKFLF
jgi:geranylgeranyl pyrophosphate synthase/tRNA G10  N-methylase Trm11